MTVEKRTIKAEIALEMAISASVAGSVHPVNRFVKDRHREGSFGRLVGHINKPAFIEILH